MPKANDPFKNGSPTGRIISPLVAQDEAIGHAVRAAYLYAGVADVAALTGDTVTWQPLTASGTTW
jgi:DUF1680 family protein